MRKTIRILCKKSLECQISPLSNTLNYVQQILRFNQKQIKQKNKIIIIPADIFLKNSNKMLFNYSTEKMKNTQVEATSKINLQSNSKLENKDKQALEQKIVKELEQTKIKQQQQKNTKEEKLNFKQQGQQTRKKQKTNKQQKKIYQFLVTKIIEYKQIIAIIVGISVLIIEFFKSRFYEEYLVKKKFGDNFIPQIPPQYVEGHPVQKQIQKIIKQIHQNQIKIVTGLPGIGKSTAINHLIKKLRSQGYVIYYINLRNLIKSDKRKTYDQLKNQILALLDGVFNEHGLKNNLNYKSVKIIIDDINKLQKFPDNDSKNIFNKIQGFAQQDNIDMICISSSSLFVKNLLTQSSILKASVFLQIQNITNQEYKKFVEQVVIKYYPEISEDAKKYMIQEQYSLRKIINLIKFIKKQQKQKQKQFLVNQDLRQQISVTKTVKKSIGEIKLNQIQLRVVQGIINSPEKINMYYCDQIANQSTKGYDLHQVKSVQNATKQLDGQNVIIYCKSRAKLQKRVFEKVKQEIIQLIKNEKNNNN